MNIYIFNREDAFFVDNSKYCFLSLLRESSSWNIHYLISDKYKPFLSNDGFLEFKEKFLTYSDGFYGYPKADLIIIDNWLSECSSRIFQILKTEETVTLQLWHGVPIKNVALVKNFQEPKYTNFAVSTSENLISVFSSFLNAGEFVISNYYRNLCFLDYRSEFLLGTDEKCLDFIEGAREDGKKIIFYMPTFRWSQHDYSEVFEFMKLLEKIALKYEAVFIVKLHPILSGLFQSFEDEFKRSGVCFYKSYLDVYPALRFADLLITDYSSIVFDFLYLEKPVIFYFPDFDLRGKELLPNASRVYELFPLAKNQAEFVRLIKSYLKNRLFVDLNLIRNLRKEFFSTDEVLDVCDLMGKE